MAKRRRRDCPPLIHGLSGCVSGMVATACLFPLDLIKTRMQNNEASSGAGRSFIATARAVVRTDGVRGLYSGLSANLVGSGVAWGLYFYGYTTMKGWLRENVEGGDSSWAHFAAANGTGATVAVLTNPIWVVKTRMQLQGRTAKAVAAAAAAAGSGSGSGSGGGPGATVPLRYTSVWHGLASLAREEGPRGLLRGVAPNLLGVTHGSIYFVAYEQLRRRLQLRRQAAARGGSSRSSDRLSLPHLSDTDTLAVSGVSKTLALLATYPLQVVRTRLQRFDGGGGGLAKAAAAAAAASASTGDAVAVAAAEAAAAARQKAQLSMLHQVRSIARNEGASGFYRGLFPAAIREIPATCITFVAYEALVRAYMGENEGEEEGYM